MMGDSFSPIERMIDAAHMLCGVCGAKVGACDCWSECRCGWAYSKGGECRNPIHADEKRADDLACRIADGAILDVRVYYPEPLKHASGGFRKTLRETIRRHAKAAILREIENAR